MDRLLAIWAVIVFAVIALIFAFGMGFVKAADPNVAATNVNMYGGFLNAVSAVGSKKTTLLIDDIQNVRSGTSVTVSPNTTLIVAPGGGVSLFGTAASGASVFFYGPIIAGPYPVAYGNGTSVFAQKALEGIFLKEWTNSGTTEVGVGKNPDTGYGLDVAGPIKGASFGGIYFVDISGQATNAQLPNPITNDVNASEALGGASAYGIHGNMTLSGLQLTGRVGEIKATSSPIVNIGDGSSGVTEVVIGHDITTAGNDSGVTYFSPTQQIYEGVGSSRTSGSTIFVISGNTGFTVVMKRTSIGWEVMSCNATVRRP